jgi:pimeloyl-ACP methyl ester carboxylesterase
LAPIADLAAADEVNADDGAVREFLGVPARTRPDLNPASLPAPRLQVTVIHGDADRLVPTSLARAYVRSGMRFVELAGATHFALIDPLSGAWPAVVRELEPDSN